MGFFLVLLCVPFVTSASLKDHENAPKEFLSGYYSNFSTWFFQTVLHEKPGNVYLSIFTPIATFGLVREGAKGKSRGEITQALRISNDIDLAQVVEKLLDDIDDNLKVHSEFFISKDIQVKEGFKEIAKKSYLTDVSSQDFSDPEAAAARINLCSAAHTSDIIGSTVKEYELDSNTKIFSITALVLQATFVGGAFDPSLTTIGDFYKSKDDTVQVQYLTDTYNYFYYEDTELNYKVLLLQLVGEELCIIFVLPNEIDGLKDLEPHINQLLNIDDGKFTEELVSIAIPKFEFASVLDGQELKKIIPSVFDGSKADLSGIGGEPGDLFINLEREKNYIRFDEGGLDAPLVTAVDSQSSDKAKSSEEQANAKEFKADHPFFFFIRQHGIAHFAGRVTNPNEEVRDAKPVD